MFKALFSTSILSLTLGTPALAAPELFIENFVGTITIETSNASEISIIRQDNIKGVNLYEDGENLKIDGGIERPDGNDCKGYHGSFSINIFKKQSTGDVGGYKNLDDFPKLRISAPAETQLRIQNSIPFLNANDLGAADLTLSSCGKVNLGDLSGGLKADIRGSADLALGNIGENAVVDVRGSGDVDMGSAQNLQLNISGSGDVDAGNVRSADIKVRGSGDVDLGDVSGSLGVDSSGSSDVDIGNVTGDFIYDGRGSGDLDIKSVTGRISINIGGSGEASIRGGEASDVKVSASGASEFNFDGTAQNADLYASGASDIHIRKVVGDVRLKESGAADIDVN